MSEAISTETPTIPWITTGEAAKQLCVTRQTLRNYCRQGRVLCRKIGRNYQVSGESVKDMISEAS